MMAHILYISVRTSIPACHESGVSVFVQSGACVCVCPILNLTSFIVVGIQTTEGEYLILHPTWSKTIEAAGTTITYIHEDNRYPDRIYIPGPTQYELNLVVRCCTYICTIHERPIQHRRECCKQLVRIFVYFNNLKYMNDIW